MIATINSFGGSTPFFFPIYTIPLKPQIPTCRSHKTLSLSNMAFQRSQTLAFLNLMLLLCLVSARQLKNNNPNMEKEDQDGVLAGDHDHHVDPKSETENLKHVDNAKMGGVGDMKNNPPPTTPPFPFPIPFPTPIPTVPLPPLSPVPVPIPVIPLPPIPAIPFPPFPPVVPSPPL